MQEAKTMLFFLTLTILSGCLNPPPAATLILDFDDQANTIGRVGYVQEFDNADLNAATGTITVVHDLDTNSVVSRIYDNEKEEILPDESQILDVNRMLINVISFMPLPGTWEALIVSGNQDNNATVIFDFSNADLVDGTTTIKHGLGNQYVQVKVSDNLGNIIWPDEITYLNIEDLNIDVTSFAPIPGTWRAIITP